MASQTGIEDVREKQTLELFKNWLVKHPFLKYTGDDDIDDLLTAWLRAKKCSLQKACEGFEFVVPYMITHPEWFANPCFSDYDYTHKPNSPLIFLKNHDNEGRRISIQKYKYFDEFDNTKFFRRMALTPLLQSFDKDILMNGVVAILDFRGANIGRLRKIPLNLIQDALKSSKCGSQRMKQINIIGMPAFFKPIFEIAKAFTSAKILQRINFINDVKELSKLMDVSLLPKEYGGSANEFLDYASFELGAVYVNKIFKFNVNFKNIKEYENVGSFRKLEFD